MQGIMVSEVKFSYITHLQLEFNQLHWEVRRLSTKCIKVHYYKYYNFYLSRNFVENFYRYLKDKYSTCFSITFLLRFQSKTNKKLQHTLSHLKALKHRLQNSWWHCADVLSMPHDKEAGLVIRCLLKGICTTVWILENFLLQILKYFTLRNNLVVQLLHAVFFNLICALK